MHIPILITVLAGTIIFMFLSRGRKSKVNKHEQELIRKCFGNKETAHRLIDLELKKNPNLTRNAAIKYAIESLLRNNR